MQVFTTYDTGKIRNEQNLQKISESRKLDVYKPFSYN